MIKLIRPGRMIFALGIIALGVLQFFTRSFIVGRPLLPAWLAGEVWAYASGILLIIAGLLVIANKRPGEVAFATGIFILVFSFFCCHLPEMAGKKPAGILWQLNAYKTLALAGGAWIVAASLLPGGPRSFVFASNRMLVTSGSVFLSLFLLLSAAAHIHFNSFVQQFIPAYIPARAFWSYFTAATLLAGGIGLLIRSLRKWAALLSGIMILLWFFLLHIPRTMANTGDLTEWMGVCESFCFSGILFVLSGLSSRPEK